MMQRLADFNLRGIATRQPTPVRRISTVEARRMAGAPAPRRATTVLSDRDRKGLGQVLGLLETIVSAVGAPSGRSTTNRRTSGGRHVHGENACAEDLRGRQRKAAAVKRSRDSDADRRYKRRRRERQDYDGRTLVERAMITGPVERRGSA